MCPLRHSSQLSTHNFIGCLEGPKKVNTSKSLLTHITSSNITWNQGRSSLFMASCIHSLLHTRQVEVGAHATCLSWDCSAMSHRTGWGSSAHNISQLRLLCHVLFAPGWLLFDKATMLSALWVNIVWPWPQASIYVFQISSTSHHTLSKYWIILAYLGCSKLFLLIQVLLTEPDSWSLARTQSLLDTIKSTWSSSHLAKQQTFLGS